MVQAKANTKEAVQLRCSEILPNTQPLTRNLLDPLVSSSSRRKCLAWAVVAKEEGIGLASNILHRLSWGVAFYRFPAFAISLIRSAVRQAIA